MLFEVNDSLYGRKDDSKFNFAINILIFLTALVLALEVLFTISYSGIYVIGPSMNNTLTGAVEHEVGDFEIADTTGDYLYVSKTAKPDYGDIVVVNKNDKTTIIKRIIAKGGDCVKLDRGELWIKYSGSDEFVLKEEPYVSPENNTPLKNTFPVANGRLDERGYYVEEGHYFLLGDNRDVSLDSRENGGTCYTGEQIYGVVTDWSLKGKNFYTKLHKFFSYDLPGFFGIDNRVKRIKEV